MTEPQITHHGSELSGHTHRVELSLPVLDLHCRFVPPPGFKPMPASPLSLPT
jgi:glutathione S-transferase